MVRHHIKIYSTKQINLMKVVRNTFSATTFKAPNSIFFKKTFCITLICLVWWLARTIWAPNTGLIKVFCSIIPAHQTFSTIINQVAWPPFCSFSTII